jgi:hypothetical protein
MLLEPLYEQDFYDFWYGFRPGRSAHDADAVLLPFLRPRRGGAWVGSETFDFVGFTLFWGRSRRGSPAPK